MFMICVKIEIVIMERVSEVYNEEIDLNLDILLIKNILCWIEVGNSEQKYVG